MKWCACLLMLAYGCAYADTLYVSTSDTSSYSTLEDAYAASNPADVIVLLPGIHTQAVLDINHAIHITAHQNSTDTAYIDTFGFRCNTDNIVIEGLTAAYGTFNITDNCDTVTINRNKIGCAAIECWNANAVEISQNELGAINRSFFIPAIIKCRNSTPDIRGNTFHAPDSSREYFAGIEYEFYDENIMPLPIPVNVVCNSFNRFNAAISIYYYCPPYCMTLSYHFPNNYWGTADTAEINALVDVQAFMGTAQATVTPYLAAPPMLPVSCTDSSYGIEWNNFAGNTCAVRIIQGVVTIDDNEPSESRAYLPRQQYYSLDGIPVRKALMRQGGVYLERDGTGMKKHIILPGQE